MSLILKCRLKDRGDITWPPVGEPEGYDTWTKPEKREWLRERIKEAADDARDAFGTLPSRTVHVSVTFKADIMVDA
jgi:hypothetical protein